MVANGLKPHLDFRFIWGPLFPFLLSIPLELSPNLFFLRVFGYISLCVCAFQLYRLNRKIFTENNAKQISLVWLVSFPPLSLLSFSSWPMAATVWPNIYAFLFILVSLNILIPATQGVLRTTHFHLVLAGLFAIFSILIRFNFIFLFLTIAVYITWLYGVKKQLIYFLLPGFVSLLLVYLFRSTSYVESWYSDTFLSLNGDTQSTGVPNFTVNGISRSVFAILLLSFIYSMAILVANASKLLARKNFIILLVTTTLIAIGVLAKIEFNPFNLQLIDKLDPWLQRSYSQIALGYIAVVLVLLVPISIVNLRRNLLFNKSYSRVTLLGLLAISSIPLNHNLNIDYIWLNCVFLISYVLLSIQLNYRQEIRSILMPSFVFCGVSLIVGLASLVQSDVYDFRNEPLKFMKHKTAILGRDLDQELSLFYEIPTNVVVKNNCPDSIYMSTNNRLLLAGKSLAQESNHLYLQRFKKSETDWIFECNVGSSRMDELKDTIRYTIVKSNGSFSVIFKSPK